MRVKIVDSHRNMRSETKKELALFFEEVKNISLEEAYIQTDFCVDYFEKEYAVKWFEAIAYEGAKVAGYLRCFRNPEDVTGWFIGDVYVKKEYRQLGLASKMYERIIDTVMDFEAAEYISSSVHPLNNGSIKLHEKMGFEDTKRPCKFPNLYFDEKETEYRLWLYKYLPVPNPEIGVEMLLPFWLEEHKEKNAKEKLQKLLEENAILTKWCGNRLVGYVNYL